MDIASRELQGSKTCVHGEVKERLCGKRAEIVDCYTEGLDKYLPS